MCLHPASPLPVPDDTAKVARQAFPRGNLLLSLRDKLGPIFDDGRFASLFPSKGQPAEAPWRLALVTLLQFAEDLSDRQAADAVRSRIDWKYLLGLLLADPGFDSTVLSEFRSRLVAGAAEALLLDAVLEVAAAHCLLKAGGAAAHGLHPCPGRRSGAEPARVCSRNTAACAGGARPGSA